MKNKLTKAEQKARLLKHYDFDEICDIIGYYDGSNEDVATEKMETLEVKDFAKFKEAILNEAIINGNFEEVILNDVRYPL